MPEVQRCFLHGVMQNNEVSYSINPLIPAIQIKNKISALFLGFLFDTKIFERNG